MRTVAFAVMLLVASNGFCQTPLKEPDTLQSLLVEVHQLRIDIEAMTVASQRVQIALYELQMQDAAVTRARQRVDNEHNRCLGLEGNRQHTAAEIQRLESSLSSGALQESEAKVIQPRVKEMKSALDTQAAEVQACQTAEAEASGQLQKDQVKLVETQERIDRLDKTLENVGGAVK